MFFEDPSLLVGLPMLALGIAGVVVAVGALVSYWIKPS
jgi:hypothetical protein